MNEDLRTHHWSRQDRLLHLLPATPLIIFYAGTVYLLAVRSVPVVAGFLLLWIATNLAIAGICAGCPYRGGYCPSVSQLYFAPFLSAAVYRGERKRSGARSFKLNLALLGLFGIGSYLFAFYWLFVFYWPERARAKSPWR